MAHVLLPCDLPGWPDIERHLSELKACRDGKQVIRLMASLLDACSVSLDPDDAQNSVLGEEHPGLLELGHFLEEVLTETEKSRFLSETLPCLASRAADLKGLKPPLGFLYSLRKEADSFQLERTFIASLLANAFFSTFPKRNSKTHPTLQDFRMIDFFTYLRKRSHQKKLKTFLRYFENLDTNPGGCIKFTRKVMSGPSLPGWLCSDRPLVPLILREDGSMHDSEPQVYRACSCTPLIGGDVLKASTSKEARLFFWFPELLIILSFVESLSDDEALISEYSRPQDSPLGFCFLDAFNSSDNINRQFEDSTLLRELNKALVAFQLPNNPPAPRPKTQDPVWTRNCFVKEDSRMTEICNKPSLNKKVSKSEDISTDSHPRRESTGSKKSSTHKHASKKHEKWMNSQSGSRSSMRTASQSSVEPLLQNDEYYTADEDSDQGSRSSLSRQCTDEASISRSDSMGFVLGDESDDSSLPHHERLDDFRKRIRKRTRRRLSRRSSRSSYACSSGSSDMEDISECPELRFQHGMRPANSEPSLVTILDESASTLAPLSHAAEMALLSMRGKKMMVTTSNGHLKAYSYDGVNPNLPVPFKAKFRRRRHHSEEGGRSMDFPSPSSSRQCSLEDSNLLSSGLLNLDLGRRDSSTSSIGAVDSKRRSPVAIEPLDCSPDIQLEVMIMWLAASMAELQALILYTLGQSQLHEVSTVYGKVLSREWTVGDLSCEVLRFCRNRLYPKSKAAATELFGQLIGRECRATSIMSTASLD